MEGVIRCRPVCRVLCPPRRAINDAMSGRREKQRRREQKDLRRKLGEQLIFVYNSCKLFDMGCYQEAIRIATALRIILHQGNKSSPSLLQSLSQHRIPLLSTAAPIHEDGGANVLYNSGTFIRHVSMRDESGAKAYMTAQLHTSIHKEQMPAYRWYQQKVSLPLPDMSFTRKKIVELAANKDGGAHVAPFVPETLDVLSTDGGWKSVAIVDGEEQETPVTDMQLLMLRQMGHEVLYSTSLMELAGGSVSKLVEVLAQEEAKALAGG